MAGKEKCRILKQIRQRIADENEIPYRTRECTHTGECSGTCPFCESEVRYLESQLKKRASLGKKIRLAAICAGMAVSVAGCTVADPIQDQITGMLVPEPTEHIEVLSGEVAWPEPEATEESKPLPTATSEPASRIMPTERPTQVYVVDELSGYVPYEPGAES